MPTGSGKSMCYQLPALIEERLTVVVSPLIALMRDQVTQLRALGVSAATLNSMNAVEENAAARRAMRDGELRLLYVSPERLMMDGLLSRIAAGQSAAAGHRRGPLRLRMGTRFPPRISPDRRGDRGTGRRAGDRLDRDRRQGDARRHRPAPVRAPPQVFLHSFDRPNIELNFAAKDQPRRQLSRFLDKHRGASGIVYCGSRDRTERLADYFGEQGHEAVAYHAGLDQSVRNRNGDRFLQEDGVIAVATIAFGMGVNKPDVRFVAHADMPSSVESYYQEIGRAGRDGLPADTLTLYGLDDMAFRRRQIDQKDLTDERRRIEHTRFSALAMLCETPACRRQTLLGYFDEKTEPCGRCDVCLGRVSSYDGTIEAQKALSAVWRTGERFGAGYLADVLCGEASDAIRRNGHESIKTFGVGADRTKHEWASILRQLFAAGALATASEEHGGFALTDKGADILKGRQTVRLRSDPLTPRERKARRSTAAINGAGPDERILAALKRKRMELAREEGVPAFVIFADRTLIDMAERRPATLDEMMAVHGVGERKLARYGDAFLEALEQALR